MKIEDLKFKIMVVDETPVDEQKYIEFSVTEAGFKDKQALKVHLLLVFNDLLAWH